MWESVGGGEGKVGGVWGSVRECGEVGGECGKVWKDVSGECGCAGERCWVSVGRGIGRVGRGVEECVGSPTFPHLSASQHTIPYFNTTSTLTPYTLPHLYHTPQHNSQLLPHIFLLLSSMFPSYLTQLSLNYQKFPD